MHTIMVSFIPKYTLINLKTKKSQGTKENPSIHLTCENLSYINNKATKKHITKP